jgi:hypothetical protein
MGRLPGLVRLGSKLVLEILPSVAATVIGGYLLTQLHFTRPAEPPAPQAAVAPAADAPTVGQERAAMREVLKERRENPEAPALVRPVPMTPPAASAPAVPTPATASAQLPAAMDSISPSEPVARPAAPKRATTTVATTAPSAPAAPAAPDVELPRPRPDATASVYVPAPPPGLPVAPARPVDAPLQVAPPVADAAASTPPVAPDPPAERGAVGTVLSTISSFVGHAANATGHTVNWVIDLPGKAISAGGRVIGVEQPPPPSRPFS